MYLTSRMLGKNHFIIFDMPVSTVKRTKYEAPRNEFFSNELLLSVFSGPKFSAGSAIKQSHSKLYIHVTVHRNKFLFK